MTSAREIEDEYHEIELYLQQAREEIGQALSNLADSVGELSFGEDDLGNSYTGNLSNTIGSTERKKSDLSLTTSRNIGDGTLHTFRDTNLISPKDVNANKADLTAVRGGVDTNIGKTRTPVQNVDFLSIFAQNNLLEDRPDVSQLTTVANSWNYTLPNPRRRPDRPKTLTPPPRLQGPNQNPFKNQDWRLYVRGEFEFRPIQDDKELDNSRCESKKHGEGYNHQVGYVKPKPRNPHVCCVQTENQLIGEYPHSAKNRSFGTRLAAQTSQLHGKHPLTGAAQSTKFRFSQNKRQSNIPIKHNSWHVLNRPKMSDTEEVKSLVNTIHQSSSKTNCSDERKEKQWVQTENVVHHVKPVLSPTVERKNVSGLPTPTHDCSSRGSNVRAVQKADTTSKNNSLDVSKISQMSNGNYVQSSVPVFSTGNSKQSLSEQNDKSGLDAIDTQEQVVDLSRQIGENSAIKRPTGNSAPKHASNKLSGPSCLHIKSLLTSHDKDVPQSKGQLEVDQLTARAESINVKIGQARAIQREKLSSGKESLSVQSRKNELPSKLTETPLQKESLKWTHREVPSSLKSSSGTSESLALKEEELSSPTQEVISASTDMGSPKSSRMYKPDIAIPPPPCLERLEKGKRTQEKQRATEKKSRKHRSRSRSNSGGELDLRQISQDKSSTRKVSQATQTDQRPKSDPCLTSRGRPRTRKLPDLLEQADTSDLQQDTDNNNLVSTELVQNDKNIKESSVHSRHSDQVDENKNGGMKCYGTKDTEVLSPNKDSDKVSGKKLIVPNTSKETQCDLKVEGHSGKQKGSKDITVQVEVYVSCTDRDRPGSEPRNRVYTDSSSRTWQRERRVSAKPLMPVIAEIQKGTDDDTDGDDVFDSSTSSSTQSRKDHSRSLSSSSATTSTSEGQNSPDAPPPPLPPRRSRRKTKPSGLAMQPHVEPPLVPSQPGDPPLCQSGHPHVPKVPALGCAAVQKILTPPSSPTSVSPSQSTPSSGAGSAVSLLDSMHRKYYPKLYQVKERGYGLQSGSEVAYSRHSNPEVSATKDDVSIVPHSKSASFAQEKAGQRCTPERLSDGAVHQKVESLGLQAGSDASSSVGSPQRSPCSTLSPPAVRKARSLESSEGESSYGSLSSAKGMELRPCSDGCAGALEEESVQSFKSEKELAEIEAVEACKWLRAAGFPQYAQMYEDQQFPIDITSVEKDHDFLDQDSIQSLFRRLNTLNKCANMKIEAPPRKSADESDEEDQCALSDKWRFQRSSRRWSRRDLDDLLVPSGDQTTQQAGDGGDKMGIGSCSSHDSVLTDNEESLSQLDDSPLLRSKSVHVQRHHGYMPDSPSSEEAHQSPVSLHAPYSGGSQKGERRSGSPMSPGLRRAASERFRGAKIFLKRIESFKSSKKLKKSKHQTPSTSSTGPGVNKVEISGPVVADSTSLQERMERLGCVDISPSDETTPLVENVTLRQRSVDSSHSPRTSSDRTPDSSTAGLSPSSKRNGRIFLDSSSSYPSASSTLSEAQSQSEDPLLILDNHLTPPPTVYPGGHRRNHSSSDIMDIQAGGGGDQKQGSFPMLVSNGYIEMGNGNQINYRTGSFNLGSESEDYRDSLVRRKAASKSAPSASPEKVVEAPTRRQTRKDVSTENRLSIYDNVPVSDVSDPQHELDMILHDLFKNINGLSQSLGQSVLETSSRGVEDGSVGDVAAVMPPVVSKETSCKEESDVQAKPDHMQTERVAVEEADQASGTGSSSNHELSDGDTPGSREEDGSDLPDTTRERRDSGVGSSLTRAPSDRRRHRIRWHSFVKSHRPSFNSRNLQISHMSAGQLMVIRKLSLLKVTSLMEKYSPTNRTGWNWIMPKFIKRFKAPDYKDKHVFGVPLLVVLQRTGQPLPQCMLYAMRCLRRTARDAVGIFRKSGVRSRIQKLHNQIEANPDCLDFEQLQAYDVADLLKQYFRELPECLLTNKLSETFIAIFTHVPSEMRLEALQAAVMLFPDENREVLQSLLLFLSDMAEHASENQMTASNLAVCFAPSLFHMCGPRNNPASSPKRGRKNMGIPDQKDLLEQKAAHECLTTMILDCKSIFSLPEDMLNKCRLSYIEQGDPVSIEELVKRRCNTQQADHMAYIDSCIQGLLRESHNKFKGWMSVSSPNHTDLAYKKVGDGHPLRLWKCSVDVEAPPVEVLNRVLRERHVWDEDLLKWRVVEKLDGETEVFQYVTNSMAPHPTHDFTEIRSWRTSLPKGACVLVSTSVEHPEAPLIGGVRGVILASRYLIEPCGSGKSRLTHMCRIDLRGHTPEWYNKAYGHMCANYVARIRDSFKQDIESTGGPETKV